MAPATRKAYGTSAGGQSPLYPEPPTLAETFLGFTRTGFLAIAVPKATPRPIEERLNTLIDEAMPSRSASSNAPHRTARSAPSGRSM